MQSNYRELITGVSPSTGAPSVPCLSSTRSFSPIKQYLYANHAGLIATALHARVIRVTIVVSRSPVWCRFAATGTLHPRPAFVSRRLRYRGTQWISYTEASRTAPAGILARGFTTATRIAKTFLLSTYPYSSPASGTRVLRRVIIAIMRLQELVTRIVRDLILRRTRKRERERETERGGRVSGIYSSKRPSLATERENARFRAKREKG